MSAGAHDQIRATDRMKHLLAFFVGFEIDVADVLLVLRHISLGAQRRHDGVAQPSPRLHVFGIAAAEGINVISALGEDLHPPFQNAVHWPEIAAAEQRILQRG